MQWALFRRRLWIGLLRRLTGAVDPKRVRQLVAKDNEIADREHKGLSIESGPVEQAFWRDDEIEFRSSLVLRKQLDG